MITYIRNHDQLKDKAVTLATINEAERKFNKEFPGEKLSLTPEDKSIVFQRMNE